MDLPVPQIMAASKPYTGKVFTVEMPHEPVHQAYPADYSVFNIKGLDKYNMPRSGDVMVPASQIQEQIVDVGGSGIVKFPRRKSWSGSRIQQRWLEHNMDTFKNHAHKRVQRRFADVWDLVVVSEDRRFLRNALLRGWPGLMPSWHRLSLDEVMEEEIPEVQVSRFQGVFRPRRLCPNLLRGSRCHYGNKCTFAHAFHELADEGWYVPGSTADW